MGFSQAESKLTDTVFAHASERHGGDRESLRSWYEGVEAKLVRVLRSEREYNEARLAKEAAEYKALIKRLLTDTTHSRLLSPEEKHILQRGLVTDLEKVAQRLETYGLSFMDVMIFHQIADFGRKVFRTEGKPENDFISSKLFSLVEMMQKNFPAYEATIKPLQV